MYGSRIRLSISGEALKQRHPHRAVQWWQQ
jgi:hypothetical protein